MMTHNLIDFQNKGPASLSEQFTFYIINLQGKQIPVPTS